MPEFVPGTVSWAVADSLIVKFEQRGLLPDINLAIALYEHALSVTPTENRTRALVIIHEKLHCSLSKRFQRTANRLIERYDITLLSMEVEDPERLNIISELALALNERFDATRSIDDIHRSVLLSDQVVSSTPSGHPFLPRRLSGLGGALHSGYEAFGSMEDLRQSVAAKPKSVTLTSHDDSDLASRLNTLGVSLLRLFEEIGGMEDLHHAVTVITQSVALASADDLERAIYLDSLSDSLQLRHRRTGSIDDLDQALQAVKNSVNLTPSYHPRFARPIGNLGALAHLRFN